MRELRISLGIILGLCVIFGLAGVLYIVIGEWIARSQLPPEMRTPEAIRNYYDDAVCLECQIGGGAMLIMGFIVGLGISLIWIVVEIVNSFRGGIKPEVLITHDDAGRCCINGGNG